MDHVSKILTFPATIDLAAPSEGLNEHFVDELCWCVCLSVLPVMADKT